ncbi:MAG TPA: hypothetical protein VK452_06110 [Dissulfurispiraceae bacterium]|nr:hypothetical protein [Dissulfurispiraceae bacterium]
MTYNTINIMDCTLVDTGIRLRDLRRWKPDATGPLPYYLDAGDNGGVMFNGRPEDVRMLLRIYNSQQLYLDIKFVSFLNAEGIAARRVSAPLGDILGYDVKISSN